MRSMKTLFQICAMVLVTAVVLLPDAGITKGKLKLTPREASGRPILTADGPDPVPKLPPPKPPNSSSAVAA